MARTTATEVKQILDTDLSDTIVDAYIAGATELVTEVLGSNTTISDTLKEQIEMWLTAHMIASTRERMAEQETAGPVSIKYAGKWDMGLRSTSYGQMVLELDPTGSMASLGGKAVIFKAITSFDD